MKKRLGFLLVLTLAGGCTFSESEIDSSAVTDAMAGSEPVVGYLAVGGVT